MLLLLSHARGLVMPTIRSRSRVLELREHLQPGDVAKAVAAALGRDVDAEVMEAAGLADGGVGRALGMLEGPALALRRRLVQMLDRLPETDPMACRVVGYAMGGVDPQPLATFIDTVNAWLSARLAVPQEAGRSARIADIRKVNRAASKAQEFNLERKPLFSVFAVLADRARLKKREAPHA